jgi:DNA processing protein
MAMNIDPLVMLAVNRMTFLKGREKLLFSDIIDSSLAFEKLSFADIQHILQRRVRINTWSAPYVLEQARKDKKMLTIWNINYTFYWDDTYPPLLREIFDPPLVLFFRGTLPDQSCPILGVVGTRHPTGGSIRATEDFCGETAQIGLPVISGLARGIDAAAHRGCLEGKGCTIAVLGSGLDTIYPRENRVLAKRIIESGGTLISEFAPGTPPLKHHFPQRNRIISGISRGVVIIEAPLKSGALITADYALEQGRDLFVHKCGVECEKSFGTMKLAEEGAPVINGADDIAAEWGISITARTLEDTCSSEIEAGLTPGETVARTLSLELSGR